MDDDEFWEEPEEAYGSDGVVDLNAGDDDDPYSDFGEEGNYAEDDL